jgi:hypothetical protein
MTTELFTKFDRDTGRRSNAPSKRMQCPVQRTAVRYTIENAPRGVPVLVLVMALDAYSALHNVKLQTVNETMTLA